MAEEKNDVLSSMDDEFKKIEGDCEEFVGNKPEKNDPSTDTEPSDNTQNSDEEQNTPASEEQTDGNKAPSPEPSNAPIGESCAYDDLDLNINQKGKAKQEDSNVASSKKGNWPKAPEHKKPGKGGGAKNIMELIWDEFIMGSYDWLIDKATNITLDFADWVLYKPFSRSENTSKSKEPEEKTVYDHRNNLIARYSQNAQKGKELFDQAHNEILENITRSQTGIAPVWKVWENEPSFFPTVVDLAQKAEEDPYSPEAAQYTRFLKTPEIMNNVLQEEILLRKMAVSLSTMDAVVNADKNILEPKVLSELIKMKKTLEKKSKPDELKENLKESIKTITPLLNAEEKPVNDIVADSLSKITQMVENSGADAAGLAENVGKTLEEMHKKIKSVPSEASIENNSKGYYNDLATNIAKIRETYKNDPEKRNAAVHDYKLAVRNAINTAQEDTDKYQSSGKLTSKKHKEKAQESLTKATSSINGYVFENGEIGGKPKSPDQTQFPLTGDKYKILKAVKEYGIGGRR